MTTWVIGDLHGNWTALERLLERLDPGTGDRLWLTGDLVNRGPDSLRVLRWASRSPLVEAAVLGNHDLKLLACASGTMAPSARDTFGDILEAPDRDELLDWLRRRPLAHRSGNHLMVHAGLLPPWSTARALALAGEVEALLRGSGPAILLGSPLWRRPSVPDPYADPVEHAAAIAGVLTGVRIVDGQGKPHPSFTGTEGEIPAGFRPWFEVSMAIAEGTTVLFGHWARLGFMQRPGAICLDGGAVYGGELVALGLDDRTTVRVEA